MKYYRYLLISILIVVSCKSDKTESDRVSSDLVSTHEVGVDIPRISNELYASLDRLRIRTDSSMNAGTAVTISERDTLEYLNQTSKKRLVLKLRGKNYYEPWLKVKHLQSGKTGWVYGGAVKYKSPQLKKLIAEGAPLSEQLYNDDLEWDGVVPGTWKAAAISNPLDFKIFLIKFKELVYNDDAAAIADLISYPIKDIETKEHFISKYHNIFTTEMKLKVEDLELDKIYRDSQGAIIGDGSLVFREVGDSYRITSMIYRGREDIALAWMKHLTDTYTTRSAAGTYSVEVFQIRKFLELTLNHKDEYGNPVSRSLGKYRHETTNRNQHSFLQETQDSIRKRLLFIDADDFVDLEIYDSQDSMLEAIKFTVVREI